MSRRNVAVMRACFEAFDRGDFEGAFAPIDESFGIHDDTRVDTGDYRGRSGFERWLMEWVSSWDDWRQRAEEFFDAGEEVVVLGRQWGRGKGSGIQVEMEFATVWTVRDDRVLFMRYFDNWEEAKRAAGLVG